MQGPSALLPLLYMMMKLCLLLQVYEYMDSDLEILIRDRAIVISPADVKAYMRMVLSALVACRAQWVLHRDIKPSNFLVSMSGAATLNPSFTPRVYIAGLLPCHPACCMMQNLADRPFCAALNFLQATRLLADLAMLLPPQVGWTVLAG